MIRPLYIFLDLDGVFKTKRTIVSGFRYDPVLSKILNDLFRLPETRVVISATCRKNFDTSEECAMFWRDLGMPDLKLHEHWYSSKFTGKRSVEIAHWLEAHHDPSANAEYVFLDDEFPNYHEDISSEAFDILRSGWMLVDTNNGANYTTLYALRGMFIGRSKAHKEAAAEKKTGGDARGISKTPSLETDQFHRSQAILQFDHTRRSDFSYSADAQRGFGQRFKDSQQGLSEVAGDTVSIRQHVAECKVEGCSICDARIKVADLGVQGV